MSNPYEAPRVPPQRPDTPKPLPDDSELERLRLRRRICAFAVGIVAILFGAAMFYGMLTAETLQGRLASGAFFASAFVVGLSATGGHAWPLYVAAPVSALWLTYLGIALPIALATEDYLLPDTLVLIFGILSTPGFVLLPIAAYGIGLDRSVRRRQARLEREVSEAEATNGASLRDDRP